MTSRRLTAVGEPLFDTDPRSGRVRAALERGLRTLRDGGALEPTDAPRIAVLRTLADVYDRDARRRDVSAFAMATAARAVTDLYNALSGNAPIATTDDLDDLVTALSTPDRDTPPG